MKTIVMATMIAGLSVVLFAPTVRAGDSGSEDGRIPVQVGDVNGDGAVTPSDGYKILESFGAPERKAEPRVVNPLPVRPNALTPNVKRMIPTDIERSDTKRLARRVQRSPIIEIRASDVE